jgi:hypothetical protein
MQCSASIYMMKVMKVVKVKVMRMMRMISNEADNYNKGSLLKLIDRYNLLFILFRLLLLMSISDHLEADALLEMV